MRLFVAAELPEEVLRNVSDIQSKLMACGADVRWVKPASMHVTLKFIGEVSEDIIGALKSRIVKAAEGFTSFRCGIRNVGFFPSGRNCVTGWARIL